MVSSSVRRQIFVLAHGVLFEILGWKIRKILFLSKTLCLIILVENALPCKKTLT